MTNQDSGARAHPPRREAATPDTRSAFADLDLTPKLLRALRDRNYNTPTPIQAQAIPHLLQGRDLLGVAQTGTGKTAAFALPMLQHLRRDGSRLQANRPRSLILTPTRELASQIAASFDAYGEYLSLRCAVVFGGVGKAPQIQALRRGLDVLVATPGRLLDLMGQRHVDLSRVEIFVLDEADRMLDMGFLKDVRRVVAALPTDRQSLLFSATMPPDISRLAQSLLRKPVRVEVSPPSTTVERVEQCVHFVTKQEKRDLLTEILRDESIERTLVFTRTKHGADRVARHLMAAGVPAGALHGNKSQGQRERALAAFRDGKVRALVATDIAARGLDVPGITHVINFDLPNIPESYVHRIGRTARAGKDGVAISFCDADEQAYLRDIEREIRQSIDVASGEPGAPVSRPSKGQRPRSQRRSTGRRATSGRSTSGQSTRGQSTRGSSARADTRSSTGSAAETRRPRRRTRRRAAPAS